MAHESPMVALVVAVAMNGVIGRRGRLPWRIPSELRHFKRITMGKPLIMGRKTFVSLGKPLAGRDNIVLTRDRDFSAEGAIVAASAEETLEIARKCAADRGAEEIMVIGGAEIYTQMLPKADRIYLTRVHAEPEGDVFFTLPDAGEWRETSRMLQDEGPDDEFAYTLTVFDRK